ncbi:MAG: sirohydrochlorin cobaltochelatase [Desulfovibrionaceae bacterium]|nr:sirohydrochlorin cobaltochelatase [Desulfovibrionaceae bacterium]
MRCAILLVAFGASSAQGQSTLKGVDTMVRARFPALPVRWAYTSHLLRERLARARQKSDSVLKALQRLYFENFTSVVVQPLQIIPGREYGEVCEAAAAVSAETGMLCRVGKPLLDGAADVEAAARALVAHLPHERTPDEDVVFMGHGARHEAVSRYMALNQAVSALDRRVHVGTMNGALALESILPRLASRRVWLLPLLSVIGRHALEDMAGPAEGSWRSCIEAAGRECVPVLRGTAEYAGFIEIWLRHLEQAEAELAEERPS